MKKPCLSVGFVLGSLLLGGPASAVVGTIDAVPAATLLLPYFEVDLNNANGVTTTFSVNNASDLAVLAHVTLWTDQSIPTLDFDIYLTGYDVQTINLRDIFNGSLPITASAGQDPKDTISPKGPVSQDIDFASCATFFPFSNPALNSTLLTHIRNAHAGKASTVFAGRCSGFSYGDNIARGYITVDTVNQCNTLFPNSAGYFTGVATDQNVLWGGVHYVNQEQNYAQGDTLVHIEACSTCFAAGDHTFYGRYNGATAADARESLPTTMAATFSNGGGFTGGTEYLVWRETSAAAPYSCTLPGPSNWYPPSFFQVLVFDEAEHVVDAEPCWWGESDCTPVVRIPNAANKIRASNLLSPFSFGWMRFNLQHPAITYPDPYAQMWLTTVISANGRFSVGYSAIQLDNANQ